MKKIMLYNHRLAIEMASYGKEHPKKDVQGILVFTTPDIDPKTSPWHELTKSEKGVLKVVYLQDFLDELEKDHPDHPLVAALKPWRIEDSDVLKENAGKWLSTTSNWEKKIIPLKFLTVS